jgi:hypothetical protein
MVNFSKKLENHFKAKDFPVVLKELFGNVNLTGYNSHGKWSTLGNIRETEQDRENTFPSTPNIPDVTPAIWVCSTARKALRYIATADQWQRLDGTSKLTPNDKEIMKEVCAIKILPSDIVVCTDFDSGFLIARKK